MAFEAFRTNGGPTFYDAVHIPWEADLLTSGLIFCFAILAFSFYIIIPGIVGKEKIFTFLRITTSLYIGAVILVSNFSMTWETAKTNTVTKYKAGTGQEVKVDVGVNIGFRGVNITLKGEKDQIKGETIDYNENFSWEGLQGRFGFGPFAGRFNQQYRAAQLRGLPLPILWIAEYFTIDGEGIRWGRHYRQAGWYSHIMLWLAFPLWILANILFCVLLRYGAYFLMLTGLSMVTSNIIWATLRNVNDLKIPFTDKDILEFSYGGSFWVCLITGLICILFGIIIFLLDKLAPSQIAIFFGVDVLQDSENIIVEEDDEPVASDQLRTAKPGASNSGANGDAVDGHNEDDDNDDDLYVPQQPLDENVPDRAAPYIVKRPVVPKRSFGTSEHRITKRWQRPRRRDPPPRPPTTTITEDQSDDLYLNAPPKRTPGQELHTIGNRESLAEDDLYENSTVVKMTRFQ
ncbi:dual oxidase maturation factor 1-like isoform X2 [Physella acuta]|uniref:dual oxidase maturation factor 1-like isoform X2 n=1 Tax=Physella acuta TaxID=109671 RepID=UPI0027DAF8E2|nr:dual oxidase maturation factor 1-like isoform X2 [Physella acuta]